MGFENWFDKEYSNYGNSYKNTHDKKHDLYGSQFVDERYDAYKAGAASRQAEIDELQKRIDLALLIVERMDKATNSTAMWSFDLDKELKGKKDE